MSRPSAQLGLFDAPPAAPEPAPRDPWFARRALNKLLWKVQAAEFMPWPEYKAQSWEALFPQLAEPLPPEEAEEYCRAFAAELARLRAVKPFGA